MKPLILHTGAAKDAREIGARYSKISHELGERFWQELQKTLDQIEANPGRNHFASPGLRRANLNNFPYHVLYGDGPTCTRVFVIRHHHRHPEFGLRRQDRELS
jgi:ParE toxin of type II toxin-antitoxin system, parDE